MNYILISSPLVYKWSILEVTGKLKAGLETICKRI